jgi:hypothetical protein
MSMTATPYLPLPLARRLSGTAVLALALAAPLAAQDAPGEFTLPEPSPTPTPAPAGPADERAGVAIPPRAQPQPEAAPAPVANPVIQPLPAPTATRQPPLALPTPSQAPATAPAPDLSEQPPAVQEDEGSPETQSAPQSAPQPLPTGAASSPPTVILPPAETTALGASVLPEWWPFAAGGFGALVLLGAAGLAWRRRQPKVLRLAAPDPTARRMAADHGETLPRLEITLEVTSATRSVMTFSLGYRLTIANRSDRAVSDLGVAVQLAPAQRGDGNAAAPGAAQRLDRIARVGPHQARTITGEVQLPLSAIPPLRQAAVPLFIPLLHATLEGEGQSVLSRSFVIGTPSTSGAGRVHPIRLDTPPGGIAGLVAQPLSAKAQAAAINA